MNTMAMPVVRSETHRGLQSRFGEELAHGGKPLGSLRSCSPHRARWLAEVRERRLHVEGILASVRSDPSTPMTLA